MTDFVNTETYPLHNYICGVTGLTCCGCSLFCEHREGNDKQMINNKTVLPVISKEQLTEMNKMSSDEFAKSCEKAGRLFNNKQTKIDLKIEEIKDLISRIGWENFDLATQMNARLIELKELLDEKPKQGNKFRDEVMEVFERYNVKDELGLHVGLKLLRGERRLEENKNE